MEDESRDARRLSWQRALDAMFDLGVPVGIETAAKGLINAELHEAATIVLLTRRPSRTEVVEGVDLSDIPEGTAEDFATAKLVMPDEA